MSNDIIERIKDGRTDLVLDYLAVHEVAHLIEMNHSAKFWRLVKRVCADSERAKAWLDAHGTDLHRYGAVVDEQA